MRGLHQRTVRTRLHERTPDRVFQVGRLPTAESGKVMRSALKEELLARAKN